MKLSFFGADKTVTGSCHCLEVGGKRILIDCGLQQGAGDKDNSTLPFAPGSIDYVLVTHAHIDHSGRLPLLVKQGYYGPIITTRLTAQLLSIMLRDSAHIQESDAAWDNQKGRRAGRDLVEPLYTLSDAEGALALLTTCDYGQPFEVCPGVRAEFFDAGHLLGSAMIRLTLQEGGTEKSIVFSGDIGNTGHPIIRDPTYLKSADYVVMETTYGDRDHEPEHAYTEELAKIIDETLGRGGNVVIPAFAVGRTQELLYYIREIKEKKMVRSVPDFPVYVDSPLAREATQIFSGDLRGYTDDETTALVRQGINILAFDGLRLTQTTEESKLLNQDPVPKVILSASGMCDAGRIRHHLKHNLWREECTVVFVGFQAVGSLGRILTDGADRVKLFGEEIAVRAKIVQLHGLSSHADRTALLRWINTYSPRPQHIFLVHGEAEVATAFAETLRQAGFPPMRRILPRYTTLQQTRWYRRASRRQRRKKLPERIPRPISGYGLWASSFWKLSGAIGEGPTRTWANLPTKLKRSSTSGIDRTNNLRTKTHAEKSVRFFVFWFILLAHQRLKAAPSPAPPGPRESQPH